MDDKPSPKKEEEKPTTEDIETKSIKQERTHEEAGPSAPHLPGSVFSPKCGRSKSEHNVRQIITTNDVTNALKSLSFGTPVQDNKIPHTIDLNLPTVDKILCKESNECRTLVDLKKFMAACFKNDTPGGEVPLQTVHTTVGTVAIVPAATQEANASCNVQTECDSLPTLANEVIVTNPAPIIEPKISKDSKADKKKSSRTASERSDIALNQRDSLSSIGSNVCRICMTRGRERLISPCNCKGSLANVHLSCLERWLNQVGRNHCELCGFSYPAIRTPRYTVVQALRLWFGNPRNRSHLQSDCLIFWLLSTVTAGLLAVCIVGTQYFVIEGNKFGKLEPGMQKEEGISHRITETAMDFFMGIVLCGYSVTVYLLWKDHYVMWNRWRRANVNVRLLLSPDTNPVPFAPRPGYQVV